MHTTINFDKENAMLRWKTLAAFIGVMAIAGLASAATITVTDAIGASYSATGTNLGAGIQPNAAIYRVDIFYSVGGSPLATEAFGAVSFDGGLTGGATRSSLSVTPGTGLTVPKPNYTGNNPAMSNIGDAGGNAIPLTYSGGQSGDLGVSNADLVAITAAIDPSNLGQTTALDTGLPVNDPRLNNGKTTPFMLGTVYVTPGATAGTFTIGNGQMSIASSVTHQLSTPVALGAVAPLAIPPAVPEPTTLALMGIGAFGLVGAKLRRRSA
jgi:PEP-CTERM motif